jgi:hypothetical protein
MRLEDYASWRAIRCVLRRAKNMRAENVPDRTLVRRRLSWFSQLKRSTQSARSLELRKLARRK